VPSCGLYTREIGTGVPAAAVGFLFPEASRPAVRPTRRAVRWMSGALFVRLVCEAVMSSPPSTKVKISGTTAPLLYRAEWGNSDHWVISITADSPKSNKPQQPGLCMHVAAEIVRHICKIKIAHWQQAE
jgi:hypothetical protein